MLAVTSLSSVQTLNGLRERSTFVTVSEKMRVPKRALWALPEPQSVKTSQNKRSVIMCHSLPNVLHLNLSVSSPPIIPSGNPGKFSTSVVVVS